MLMNDYVQALLMILLTVVLYYFAKDYNKNIRIRFESALIASLGIILSYLSLELVIMGI